MALYARTDAGNGQEFTKIGWSLAMAQGKVLPKHTLTAQRHSEQSGTGALARTPYTHTVKEEPRAGCAIATSRHLPGTIAAPATPHTATPSPSAREVLLLLLSNEQSHSSQRRPLYICTYLPSNTPKWISAMKIICSALKSPWDSHQIQMWLNLPQIYKNYRGFILSETYLFPLAMTNSANLCIALALCYLRVWISGGPDKKHGDSLVWLLNYDILMVSKWK